MVDDLNLVSPEEMADPAITVSRLLAGPRCRYYDRFDPPFYIVWRYEDVTDVLRRSDEFLSGHGQGPNFAPPEGVVSDPPMHSYFRKLVQQDFQPRSISALVPRLQNIATSLLDEVEGRSVWDLHDSLAFPLPVAIICEIFGIPTDDLEQFKIWSDAMGAALSAQDPKPYEAEMGRMRSYLIEALQEKRASDDTRLLARIAQARRDGVPLTDDEAVALVLQIFVAGNETTTSLITNFVWRMAAHGLWQDFCEGRIDTMKAINESLRYDPPLLGLFRTTAKDVQIAETLVPANSKVLTHYGAANRDPDVFERPNEFDVSRPSKNHLSFGHGIHICLGRELARLEAQIALETLRDRFPGLELEDDGERVSPFLFWGRKKLPVRTDG